MSELWTRGIYADGWTATVDQQREAWSRWMASNGRTATRLASELIRAGDAV